MSDHCPEKLTNEEAHLLRHIGDKENWFSTGWHWTEAFDPWYVDKLEKQGFIHITRPVGPQYVHLNWKVEITAKGRQYLIDNPPVRVMK